MDTVLVRNLLSEVSFVLIGFEEGDLMALSSFEEVVRRLVPLVSEDELLTSLVEITMANVKDGLSGKSDFQQQRVSMALDLMERVLSALEMRTAVSENLKGEVMDFTTGNAEPAIAAPISQSSRESSRSTAARASPEINPALLNSEAFQIFLAEAQERIEQAQGLVLELESDPNDKTFVDTLFRIFHTIKGECGFLKIVSLGELAHSVESLLDLLRSGKSGADDRAIELLLQGVDFAKEILAGLVRGDVAIFNQLDTGDYFDRLHDRISEGKATIGDVLQAEGKLSEAEVVKILQRQKESNFTKKFGEIAQEKNLLTGQEIEEAVQKQKRPEGYDFRRDPLIKVRTSQVNFLVDMIGELLIVGNQLDEHDKNVVQLKKISRGIQAAAMQLRTVSVKNLFINIKRIARDTARKLGKEVEVETRGDDLEIDRNLVEILEEPLMHLVRNSIGHGIESAEVRREGGKSTAGNILLQAHRLGNTIVVAVRDDGAGLDEEKILMKAIEKGLVTDERRANITRNEVLNLIFMPGFSTADGVDSISGRGVGLDIVKSTVGLARGRVETKSEFGLFTEFSLVFPLSLAIIDGMIVRSASSYFILPVAEIVETLKIEEGRLRSVEGRVKVLNLRGEVIPVIEMGDFFFGTLIGQNDESDRERFAVVVEGNERKFALMVDEVVAKKEVVIKSLGKMFKNLPAVSSAAVLPGGKVGFVVNIEEITRIQRE